MFNWVLAKAEEESLKGDIFKTRRIGKGELDKRSLETRMVHCEKEIFEVRDEVKAAFGRGMEVGAALQFGSLMPFAPLLTGVSDMR